MNNQTLTPEMLSANPQLNQVLQFFQEKYGKEAFPDKILGKPETNVNAGEASKAAAKPI